MPRGGPSADGPDQHRSHGPQRERRGRGSEVKPILVISQYQSAGTDTGFRKWGGGGGPANC